jgi:hypothetical protein
MTENNPSPSSLRSDAPKPRRSGGDMLWLLLALLIAAGFFAALFLSPVRDYFMPPAGGNTGPLQKQMNETEREVQALEARVSVLEARGETRAAAATPSPPPGEQPSVHTPATADLAHMQSDLAQLASTVGGLQDQIRQTGAAAHAVTHAAVASMIAFVQLRDAAASDHGFDAELEAMRAAAKDDPALKQPLDKLAPYADKGAPGMALLREELDAQASAVEVATAKAGAQTWWERILAELRGLVLIRPLHGGGAQSDILEKMNADLAQDNPGAALADMNSLPPEAQQVLADWRKQAEARAAIMESLHAIAARLIAADTEATPPGSDKDAP